MFNSLQKGHFYKIDSITSVSSPCLRGSLYHFEEADGCYEAKRHLWILPDVLWSEMDTNGQIRVQLRELVEG